MDVLNTLIQRAQSGDTDAYNAIVVRFQDMAVGYAYTLLKDFHLSQDAAQEAFIAAFQELPKLRSPHAFATWFRRIVFKQCDRLKRGKQYDIVSLDDVELLSPAKDPMARLETQEMKALVLNAIHTLPESEVQVITLFYISEYSHTEIAAFLDMPITTVNNRLRAAKKRLKKGLLNVTKDALHDEAPSRDNKFAQKIAQLIKPEVLNSSDYHAHGKAPGTDIWDMICASIKGDLDTVSKLVKKNPVLATCKYYYTQPIQFAVREGHTDLVQYLLDHGADPTYDTYHFHDSLVTIASDRGHHDVVEILEKAIREKSGGFSTKEQERTEKLKNAVIEGDYKTIASLIEQNPKHINLSDADGVTALHVAIGNADFNMMRYLLDNGADIHAQGGRTTGRGRKPIHVALFVRKRNNPNLFERRMLFIGYLLAKGADYNILTATILGDIQHVRKCLEADPASANFEDTCERTPIGWAAGKGNREIVELLLKYGANPNHPESHAPKGSALHGAAFHGHIEIAELLLKHGADPNSHVDSTNTAIAHAKKYPELYKKMLSYGGIEVEDPHPITRAIKENDLTSIESYLKSDPSQIKHTSLGQAARNNNFDLVKLLVKYGAKIKDVSNPGWSYFNHLPITKYLLENGTNPNHKNWLGITVLHEIASKGEIEKAKLFLDFGADVNAIETEHCSTPLGWAARHGQQEMVAFLLERGAKINLPNDEPWATPLAWAEKRDHTEIANLLRQAGATS